MYKISVIVPVYKTEKYLPSCLESIAAQTVFDKIQLILVDDGSPDNCGEICDKFATKHNNILVIHKENGGVSSARNAGLDAAQGEYIGFVDSDDTIAPDYYEKLLEAVEKNGCDMACNSITLLYGKESRVSSAWYPVNIPIDRSEIVNGFALKMLTDAAQNSVCNKLLKSEIIKDNKLYFPVGVKIGEDKMFVLKFLRYCNSAVFADACGYYYRDVGSSAMHSEKLLADLLVSFDMEAELFIRCGLDSYLVYERKAVAFFDLFSVLLQRCYSNNSSQAKAAIKTSFENKELMDKIDLSLDYVKANNGRIYNMLADAFKKRSVTKTMIALAVQNIITKIGERK